MNTAFCRSGFARVTARCCTTAGAGARDGAGAVYEKPGCLNNTRQKEQVLALMIAEPVLIRRPLLEVEGQRSVGFEAADVMTLLGLDLNTARADESCPRNDGQRCP